MQHVPDFKEVDQNFFYRPLHNKKNRETKHEVEKMRYTTRQSKGVAEYCNYSVWRHHFDMF